VPQLSIIIPAYNEEPRLAHSLEKALSWLADHDQDFEIIVVDDGSTDATVAVAHGFADRGIRVLSLPRNQGKGAAVRQGILASDGQRVLISDADFSTPIEDLARLESRLGEAPVVLGSRAVAGARVTRRQPLYREFMGKTFNKILRLFGVRGINDTQCGFKLLDGDVARTLFSCIITPGFAFDVELVWLAQRLGHRVVEVGVTWEDSPASRVQPLTDPPKMILEILLFRWHHRHLHHRHL
jgi:dolichyl-phosphate beta-glucosyltransferase